MLSGAAVVKRLLLLHLVAASLLLGHHVRLAVSENSTSLGLKNLD